MDLLVRRGQRKPVERTDDRPNGLCCDLRVEGRRVYLGVAEQDLDDADVDAIFEKMGGETVPQRVRSDPLVDVRGLGGLDDDAVELARADMGPCRSEARRVRQECVSPCRYRWSPDH